MTFSFRTFQHSTKLLASNGILAKFINKSLSTNLEHSLSVDSTPQELYKSTFSCLEVLLMNLVESESEADDGSEEDLKTVGKSIINFMFLLKQDSFPENDFISIATACINCLKFITQMESEFATENVGELLGISKSFILYSIPDITQQPPTKIASSQQAIMDPVAIRPNKRNNGMTSKTRKSRKSNKKKSETVKNLDDSQRSYGFQENSNSFGSFPAAIYRTSDSDYSDNEHNREFASRHKQSKLRLAALSLLSILASIVEKKILFGYWHSLFSTEESTSATLINCVLKDTSPRCKILALQTIILLLKNSKPFLIQAEKEKKGPSTFTPFSVTLGNMIEFTYEKLTQALVKEGDLTVLTQILKCVSTFIPATPFHRLKTGIVTGFVKYVRLLTRHKDPTIKVASLIVMGNLISISDITSEIYELLEIPKSKIEFSWKKIDESIRSVGVSQDDEDEIVDLEFEDEEEADESEAKKEENETIKMSWLLQAVLENLGIFGGVVKTPSLLTSVRIESLQVLSAMTSHYLLLKDHLAPISSAIVKSLQNSADEQLYACRALDFLGSSINVYLSQDKKNLQDLEASVGFWLIVIPSAVAKIQDVTQPPALRASLADGLANIGVHVFEKLEHQKQILLISVLTGCSYDEDANVKSSAIRALAVYVLFPSLRDDLCYVENTIESILRIIKDQNVLTRTKASWSLGNVVDALLMTKENQSINERLMQKIFETSLEATSDNDRVKVNAVRTLGNLMTLLTQEQLSNPNWLQLLEKSIQSLHNLLLNCGNVKVKWNVCYSFSTFMKNSIFFDPALKFKWQELVFPALCDVIRTSPNFKVRINACVAFTVPKREHFGNFFINIWSCLLVALEQSNNLTDFNEYKHRDTLQDQLCSSLCHIISISTLEDVGSMKNEVFPLIDITKQNWNRVFNRWLPECQGKICTAVNSLKCLEGKTSEQKNSIEILISCFQPLEQF